MATDFVSKGPSPAMGRFWIFNSVHFLLLHKVYIPSNFKLHAISVPQKVVEN